MPQDLKGYFQQHPGFQMKSGIFFQSHLNRSSDFEGPYLLLRQQEGRIFDDNLLTMLPLVTKDHVLHHEWNIRRHSAEKLVSYLVKKKKNRLVEIGCGNGWLLRYLCATLQTECVGIDVNLSELQQAARVFGNIPKLSFVYGDILSDDFEEPIADIIVVASVIQYFPDLKSLFNKLVKLLLPSGEIHILDSPLYTTQGAASARERSNTYFKKAGSLSMTDFYFHHTWKFLQYFNHQVLYNPATLWNKVKRLNTPNSPFPWIKISPF